MDVRPAMRVALRAMFALAAIAAVAVGIVASDPAAVDPRKPRYDDPDEAAAFFVSKRVTGDDELTPARWETALAQRAAMPQAGALRSKLGTPVWRPIGPTGVGGRTRAILVDPVEPDTVYVASVSGGVWKSTDGARSWQPSGQAALVNLAVVTLVLDPADRRTIYAGTGEGVYVGRPVRRSRAVRGDGVFVSRDAGATWRQLDATRGNADFDYVNKLAFDDAGRLHAATRTGLWTSSDRGATWRRGLQPPNAEGCSELVHVPPSRLLASCGVFSQSSLYVSNDGGTGWTAIASPAFAGRTALAVSRSNPLVVYAASAHRSDYGFLALRRSNDGGQTWSVVTSRASTNGLVLGAYTQSDGVVVNGVCRFETVAGPGQGWFDNLLAVDPVNHDVVFVGGVDLYRSDDGGASFRMLSRWFRDPSARDYVHADQHTLVFDPRYDGTTNRRVYVGNDGGVFVSEDARTRGATNPCDDTTPTWESRNAGYQATQFYDGGVSGDGTRVIGGLQDNGTRVGTTAAQPWREVYGGDGGYAFYDPRDARRYYFSTQGGQFHRTDDDGANVELLSTNGLPLASGNYLFIAPLLLDPNDPDVLWTGASRQVWRSDTRGNSWSATGFSPITGGTALVSALSVARGDSNRVAVGFDNGVIGTSRDEGLTWSTVEPRTGFVSSLTHDPVERDRVYATYGTFGGAKVLASSDGGATFTAIDGGAGAQLPDVPVHALVIDPRDRNRLWIGTDVGVFTSPDRGARWHADASGLPNVVVEQLVVAGSGADAELVAFTYGNGIYRARLADLGAPSINPGYTGAWYDVAVPGQGMMLEVLPQARELAVGWYTYGVDGGHAWLVGNGPLVGARATLPLYSLPSGRFAGGETSQVEEVGQLTIDFADCSSATASYTVRLGAAQRTGTIALTRLTSERYCSAFRAKGDGALSELAVEGERPDLEYGHGGLWFDPAAARQGFVIDVDPRTQGVFGGWYTYDPLRASGAGEAPTWYTVQGTLSGPVAELAVLRTTAGRFATPTGFSVQSVGTMRLTARSCSEVDAEYAIVLTNGAARQGMFALDRVAAATVCEAMAP